MADFNWDIPPSPIRTNREWTKKLHAGLWCVCVDVQRAGETVRMVLQATSDQNRVKFNPFDRRLYLVGPSGKRLDN
ncbi:MAG: hypothetical protein ACWGQW_01800 [bacterium]